MVRSGLPSAITGGRGSSSGPYLLPWPAGPRRPLVTALLAAALWIPVLPHHRAAQAHPPAARSRLFLLAATAGRRSRRAAPAVLYTVGPRHNLVWVRSLGRGTDGLYAVLADTHGHLFLAIPRPQPTAVVIVHERHPDRRDIVALHPGRDQIAPAGVVAAVTAAGRSYALFPLVGPRAAAAGSRGAALLAVVADPSAGASRVIRNRWSLYRNVRYSGSFPLSPPPLRAVVRHGQAILRIGRRRVRLGAAPRAAANGAALTVAAMNRRFVVFTLARGRGRKRLWVHDRLAGLWWSLRAVPGTRGIRLFGPWVAFNTGRLLLLNLVDNRRIAIPTHGAPGEILAVRADSNVLYRIANRIYQVQVIGGQLGVPVLVAQGAPVWHVHWAFWSRAPR